MQISLTCKPWISSIAGHPSLDARLARSTSERAMHTQVPWSEAIAYPATRPAASLPAGHQRAQPIAQEQRNEHGKGPVPLPGEPQDQDQHDQHDRDVELWAYRWICLFSPPSHHTFPSHRDGRDSALICVGRCPLARHTAPRPPAHPRRLRCPAPPARARPPCAPTLGRRTYSSYGSRACSAGASITDR